MGKRSQARNLGGGGMTIPEVKRPEVDGNGTVTVGCKLPNGLHLDEHSKPEEPIVRVTLRGANATQVIGGYGITKNVPRSFFERWMERNASLAVVKNGLIFAHSEESSVKDYAIEREDEITGLEPLDQQANGVEPLERD